MNLGALVTLFAAVHYFDMQVYWAISSSMRLEIVCASRFRRGQLVTETLQALGTGGNKVSESWREFEWMTMLEVLLA